MAKRTKKTKARKGPKLPQVPAALVEQGLGVFDSMLDKYLEPETGLDALQEQVKEAAASIAADIMAFATELDRSGKGVQVFLDVCANVEAQVKEREKVSRVDEVLPPWAQYKSDIKRAWLYKDANGRHPFRPSKFKSAQTLKSAYLEQTRKDREANKPNAGPFKEASVKGINEQIVATLAELTGMAQKAAKDVNAAAAQAALLRVLDGARDDARSVLDELIGQERPQAPEQEGPATDETEEAANA